MKKTIILKPGGLGDIICSTPSIRAYKKSFPQDRLIYFAGKTSCKVLEHNPYIDQLECFNDIDIFQGHIGKKLIVARELSMQMKKHNPDRIIVLQRDWRWNALARKTCSKVYGFKRDMKGFFTNFSTYNPDKHEVEQYLDVFGLIKGFRPNGYNSEIFLTDNEINSASELIPEGKIIALAAGGGKNAKMATYQKRWPYFRELSKMILDQTDYKIAYIGTEDDRRSSMPPYDKNGRVLDFYGRTSIREAAAILKHCDMLVSSDNGIMHMGNAVNIPVIGIFGPTDPKNYMPINHPLSSAMAAWKDCVPCMTLDGRITCQAQDCLKTISPQAVFEKLKLTMSRAEI